MSDTDIVEAFAGRTVAYRRSLKKIMPEMLWLFSEGWQSMAARAY